MKAFTERPLILQLAVMVLACQIMAHFVTIVITVSSTGGPDPARFTSVPALKAGAVAELLVGATPGEREVVLALVARQETGLGVANVSDTDLEAGPLVDAPRALRRLFPGIVDQVGIARAAEPWLFPVVSAAHVYVRVDATRAIVATTAIEPGRTPIESIFLRLTIFLVVIPLALGTLWALLSLTAPLRRFATTADRFAVDLDSTPLPVRGSSEMRSLAQAFNSMRGRIRDLVENRSRMLAAVSHDLRTPLSRIRLRAEAQVPSEEREKTLRDVASMDKMIGQALAYLRDGAAEPRLAPVDLASLVAAVRDDFSDAGGEVAFESAEPVVALVDTGMMVRAVANLVDNALKYAGRARLEISTLATEIVVSVADDGPGVPDADKARVFEPFSRGDPARSGASGFGMGLAISKQIVDRHGGRVELVDARPTGLVARIVLPRPAEVEHFRVVGDAKRRAA